MQSYDLHVRISINYLVTRRIVLQQMNSHMAITLHARIQPGELCHRERSELAEIPFTPKASITRPYLQEQKLLPLLQPNCASPKPKEEEKSQARKQQQQKTTNLVL